MADWTRAQDIFLADHVDWQDDELAEAISVIGPARTETAVRWRRDYRGLPLQPFSKATTEAKRLMQVQRTQGWPVLIGTDEERDDLFVRLLLEAQLKNIRSQNKQVA